MTAQIISLSQHRPDQPDALERAWDAYTRALTTAQAKPNIPHMRAAVEAFDRWEALYLADEQASGGPAC